ncbi:MAG: DUF2267 domain-containing protein [Methylohalobius sp.]
MSNFEPIERTVQKTFEWLKEIGQELGSEDKYRAYHALRSVLHHLRDRLSVDDSANLAAELPMLIRGLYYEGWQPSKVPLKIRSKDEFLDLIRQDFSQEPEVDAAKIARAVFSVLERHISEGEAKEILHSLPKQIREIFA